MEKQSVGIVILLLVSAGLLSLNLCEIDCAVQSLPRQDGDAGQSAHHSTAGATQCTGPESTTQTVTHHCPTISHPEESIAISSVTPDQFVAISLPEPVGDSVTDDRYSNALGHSPPGLTSESLSPKVSPLRI